MVQKSEGKKPLGTHRCRWENNSFYRDRLEWQGQDSFGLDVDKW